MCKESNFTESNFTPIVREIKVSRVDEKPLKHLKEGWHTVFTPNGVKKTALFLERAGLKRPENDLDTKII